MAFHPFEVNVPHLAYAFLGGFVVIVSIFHLTLSLDSFCDLVRGFGTGFYPLSSFLPSISHPPNLAVFVDPFSSSTPLVLRLDDLSVCRFVEELEDLDLHGGHVGKGYTASKVTNGGRNRDRNRKHDTKIALCE
jgi:hypothetical protein